MTLPDLPVIAWPMAEDHSGGDVEGRIGSPLVSGDIGPTIAFIFCQCPPIRTVKKHEVVDGVKRTDGFVSPGNTIGAVICAIGAIRDMAIEITVGRVHVQVGLNVEERDLGRCFKGGSGNGCRNRS